MLEFIFGPPKSGKTTEIINRIKTCVKEGKRTYLLVPEQQVHVSETMLAAIMPEAWTCFEVISFSRLCEMIFTRYGGITKKSVDDNVKHLLMWYSANSISDFLCEYKQDKNDSAFSDMMLSAITELSTSGLDPESLEKLIEESDDEQFKKKFSDIALIYSKFKSDVAEKLGKNIMLKDDLQKLALRKLSDNKFFEGACVFVDSFTDFTGIEEKMLLEIIKSADSTTISINLPARGYSQPHAHSVRDTLKKLTAFAKNNYIEAVDTVIESNGANINSKLAKIEKHLWDFSYRAGEDDSKGIDDSSINMATCKNAYEEAEYVAIKILQEKNAGVKFSEMAVIMRNAESYKGIINAIFDKYSIPYFYSEKTDISTTSPARYILSSLHAVATNLRLDDILTLTKTGLCPISNEECDMFEDYCTTWNINGDGFRKEAFNMNPNGYTLTQNERGKTILEAANKVKETIIPPLDTLKLKLSAADNTEKSIQAICEYIEETGLANSISALCELELSAGNVRECSEIIRVYDYILDSLHTISEIFKDQSFTVGEIINALGIMFANTDIASVPPIDDYVTIGSASTLRVENIKTAFIMGLCEGEFPAAVTDSGIIKDADKNILDALGVKLASTEEKRSSDELYFVYSALTKPQDKLYLTYPSFSINGRAKAPSFAWNRIKYILGIDKSDIEEFDLSRIKGYTDVQNQKPAPECDTDEANENNVDPERARLIFGDSIRLSKSQISTFTLCPYRYWCENVLRLRENKSAAIGAADIGTLVHYVLEKYLKEFKSEDGKVIHNAPDVILQKASEITEGYIEEIGFIPTPSALYSISKFRNTAYYMLMSIDKEFEESDFRILSLEENIADRESSKLKPIYIDVPVSEDFSPKVILGGAVDRIDVFKDGSDAFLRIVDYKTGSDSFNIDKISDGHDIQLPVYLFAVTDEKNRSSSLFSNLADEENPEINIIPASALFFSTKEKNGIITPFRSGFILNDEKVLKATNHSLDKSFMVGTTKAKNEDGSPRNYVDSEKMEEIKETLVSTVSDIAKNIYSGKAPRCPSSDACRFCKIKNQCPVAVNDKSF